ncbi:hypothetical protein P6U16_05485 [Rhizobium sp. 32-5/1]|uniref:hypothetical protein n=1 Tax=Rhizobium sp. 32-5/1 TaxID=3019602 RepID=UPI00240D6760|nr:hypothetical protein [Rhizobium sp. 32-5/1]WEZ84141.1 hypothetical protein P6U16_05485 [Rhizobium sp. 32-5/1]
MGNLLLVWTILIGVKATKAATRAAVASEKGLELGQRAFLALDLDYSRQWDPDAQSVLKSISIEASIKNQGATPAAKCTFEWMTAARNSDGLFYSSDGHRLNMFSVGASEKIGRFSGSLEQDALESITSGATEYYLLLKIEYEDLFTPGHKHKLSKAFKLEVNDKPENWSRKEKRPALIVKRVSDRAVSDSLLSIWRSYMPNLNWVEDATDF